MVTSPVSRQKLFEVHNVSRILFPAGTMGLQMGNSMHGFNLSPEDSNWGLQLVNCLPSPEIKLLEDIFGKDYHQSNQNMSTCNFIDDYVDSRIRIADQVSLNIKTSSMFWFTNA
ncbi:rCG46522 [Rattus norvegicus]|uniref:RCG46522 n=1 Tax=Rattus norvegicus TaxID=10116 RepID=A6ICV7_RAT|nr:rCG46522 [Rattus norvegicus]